jgi:hypothetical protein
MRYSQVVVLSLLLTMGLPAQSQDAQAVQSWVKDERAVDGGATIYLGKRFGSKSGTFRATPESMLDTKDKISGNFIVGQYRYVYDKPLSQDGLTFNELIATELLDCKESYYGRLRVVKKLNDKEVLNQKVADSDVSMTQTQGPSIAGKLCALHTGGKSPSLDPKKNANPAYVGDRAVK